MADTGSKRTEDLLVTAIVWAYVGLIFGTVYIGLVPIFEQMDWQLLPEIPAAALSGAVGAVFYNRQ